MRSSDKAKGNILTNSFDKQIFDTKHDEIVVWLYSKLKTDLILVSEVCGINPDLILEHSVNIEHPIRCFNNRIRGFVDVALSVRFAALDKSGERMYWYFEHGRTYASKIKESLKHTVTCSSGDTLTAASDEISRNFEVKTSVNIGETIRQIGYYDTKEPWYVCAPDFPHKDILIEQGIGFIPYVK